MQTSIEPASAAVGWGIDAPGWVIGLCGAGMALAALAGLIGWIDGPVWAWLPPLVLAAAPMSLGLSMLAYALRGKVRLRDHMLGLVPWRGDERVLDIGAGRGLMAIGAAKRAPRGQVTAIDIWRAQDLSGNTPEALSTNAFREGVAPRITILTEDASRTSLPDAAFEVVLSVLVLHNIEPDERREAACREIARVLRPGGRAIIADYTGTAQLARWLRQAGLTVDGPRLELRVALSPMSVLIATKPG